MILFGLIEVVAACTHHFLGIPTYEASIFTCHAAAIGAFYVIAGRLIPTMKKRAAAITILLHIAGIIGRIALAIAGLYPVDSFEQIFAIYI